MAPRSPRRQRRRPRQRLRQRLLHPPPKRAASKVGLQALSPALVFAPIARCGGACPYPCEHPASEATPAAESTEVAPALCFCYSTHAVFSQRCAPLALSPSLRSEHSLQFSCRAVARFFMTCCPIHLPESRTVCFRQLTLSTVVSASGLSGKSCGPEVSTDSKA